MINTIYKNVTCITYTYTVYRWTSTKNPKELYMIFLSHHNSNIHLCAKKSITVIATQCHVLVLYGQCNKINDT